MRFHHIAIAMLVIGTALGSVPVASVDSCPDVQVVYARGTDTTPAVDPVGQAFVNTLSSQIPGRSLAVYGVNYPATLNLGASASQGFAAGRLPAATG